MLRNSVLDLPEVFTVTVIEHIITELCRSSQILIFCTKSATTCIVAVFGDFILQSPFLLVC